VHTDETRDVQEWLLTTLLTSFISVSMLTGTLISQLGNEDGMGPGAGSQAGLQGFSPSSPKAGAVHAVVLSDIGHICGARVGGKGKFCIKVRGLCTTESHKPTKRENGLHLMAGDEKVWEKGASLAGLPSSVLAGVQDMMIRNLSRDEWMAVQAAIQEIHDTDGGAERQAMLKNYEDVLSNLMVHHPLPSEVDEHNSDEVQAIRARVGTTPMKARSFKSSGEDDMDRFSGLSLAEQVFEIKEEINEQKAEGDKNFSDAFMAVKKVSAAQGTVGSEDPPLREQLQLLEKTVTGLGHLADGFLVFQKNHQVNFGTVKVDVDTLNDDVTYILNERIPKIDKAFIMQLQTVMDLSASFKTLKGQVVNLENTSIGANAAVAVPTRGVTVRSFNDLEVRVDALEAAPTSSPPAQGVPADVGRRLAKLEKASAVASERETVKVDGGRWVFNGKEGASDWLDQSGVPMGCNTFGFGIGLLCQDPNQLLLEAESNGTMTREEFQQSEVHAKRVGRAAYDSTHATSAQSMLPSCLTIKGGNQLSKLKTYEDWDAGDGERGVGVVLQKALRDIRAQEQERVAGDLSNFPKLKELAMHFLNSTFDFLGTFFSWIGNYYRVMVVNTGASSDKEKAECWKLVLTMIATVFEVLWETRRPAKNAYLAAPREALVTCLYSAARTQSIMKAFERNNFSEHPRIFPKLMTFIFESHTSKTEFMALKKAHGVTVNKVDTLQTKMDNVLNRLKQLERGGGGGGGGGDDGDGGKWKGRKDKGRD